MDDHTIALEPLTAAAFAPFGDVLAARGAADMVINGGLCDRFHDLADVQVLGEGARAGISLFRSRARTLPYRLDLMERHPLGSQAFMPLGPAPFLVIVAPDAGGRPGRPRAFRTAPGQGVNYHAGVWHGVLTPLVDGATFLVVDRIGPGENLEEVVFETPYVIVG
ncbi:MAG: ureidoglycolate lyase [Rhodobacterales bacterium]|nr:ureidoglycolate lyase [Rhodobacterales bacterium]